MSVAELDFIPRTSGRAKRPPSASFVSEICESDLVLLASERGTAAPSIQRLRDRHHSLARCLASGMSNTEASAVTGYDPSRISILKKDPTFVELMTHYQDVKESSFAEFQDRAAVVASMALDRLAEAFEDEEDRPSVSMALEVAKQLGDRTGNAPITKSLNVSATVDFGSKLAEARKRVLEARIVPEAESDRRSGRLQSLPSPEGETP